MTPEAYLMIELLAFSFSAVFALASAVLEFLERLKDDENDSIRRWFTIKLTLIDQSGLLEIPYIVIQFLVKKIRAIFSDGTVNDIGNATRLWFICISVGACIFLYLSIDIYSKSDFSNIEFIIYLSLFVLSLLNLIVYLPEKIFDRIPFQDFLELFIVIAYFVYVILTSIATTFFAIKFNIFLSLLVYLVFMPLYIFFIMSILSLVMQIFLNEDLAEEIAGQFAIGAGYSFFLTLLALAIGHFFEPSVWVPQTLQVLFSNVVFDGITFVMTILVLRWALGRSQPILWIPFVVVLDITISAFLACASLFFGLVATEHELFVNQIFNVLIMRAPDGSFWQMGPYFWVMHTAFIPTALYLFIILACWILKIIIQPVAWFFGKAAVHKHPLRLTAGLCGIFTAAFFLLGYIAQSGYKLAQLSSV